MYDCLMQLYIEQIVY